ncbi:sulfite exporter TauE/SafE family protein [Nesterenkonia marinintestina]|uniref:sulfite exporter TauE/SafE family protein n=1 Tax=Nesterenkonia marinintestina TaxID=2979865 RepID=UPI0021C00014|nr:sulfite exporter TauE/SafE family protein [Nesterenkonia sp. GX14115]
MPTDWLQVLEWAAVVGAGFLAGGVNVIVGAGTLVSFPILVLLGMPPLAATIANTIGIVPGSISGAIAYRRELRTHASAVRVLLPASALGAIAGASLLLHFSAEVFARVIPWLIGIGTLLVIAGPTIRRRFMRTRSDALGEPLRPSGDRPFPTRMATVTSLSAAFLLGVYGGYFSAAQGILLIALLGITSLLHMQELNAIKNLTVAVVNIIAASIFIIVSPEMISWSTVALIAAGSTLGGLVGGRLARRLSAGVFRMFVVIVGAATVIAMTMNS